MAKRKSLKTDPCPVARALDVIGDRWSLLIVRDAYDGMRRFGEFQKSLGVARNILADRLHTLVEEGIFSSAPASDGTAYQEYVLTEKGLGLFPIVVGLRQWSEDQLFEVGEAHSTLLERNSGTPVSTLQVLSPDGRVLQAGDTFVHKLKP
ncbi:MULTISPECIES: helix-turn-helix domain-containing protein [unclassified Janthinobacterium]|uniref:winged helix-turn-helix transcriptional regulator n=1 Tax=unclassified Janthinobacterium TaxID=2610881 RepID=UPI001621BAC6|nr:MULTISPECIES: helix-turn-helix domain-containing protein [unclassified Janthinobacterium]